MSYVVITMTQNNSINGDIGGVSGSTSSTTTYSALGVISPALSANNTPPILTTISALSGASSGQAFNISYATLAAAADESDPEGASVSFRVEAVSSGTLTEGGSNVTTGSSLLSSGETWVWTSASNASGTTAAFTVKAHDGTLASADAIQVNVSVGGDTTAPSVSSINRQSPSDSTTAATSVTFRVTFSESVSGVDTADFTLTKTSSADGTIASVSASSGSTIDVTVNSITGAGTLRLDLKTSGTGITDMAGNAISGGFSSGQTYTVSVANSAPSLSGLASSASYAENTLNAAAQLIDSSVIFSDDNSNLNGGNLTVSYSSGGGTQDQLSIRNFGTGTGEIGFSSGSVTYGGTSIGTVPSSGAGSGINGETLVVTFNSNATPTAIDTLIENLTYQNTSNAPTASRTISLTVNDGSATSTAQTVAISVTAENDTPTLAALNDLTILEDATPRR